MKVANVSAFGPPAEVIELIDVPDPGPPGPGEVVLAAQACPINPADVLNLEGLYGATPPPLPMIPGAEGVGRVEAVGDDVTHVKLGDQVLLASPSGGMWREKMTVPAAMVYALPKGGDLAQMAMLRVNPPTAYLMLRDFVTLEPGDWVIQNAANSGVGNCLIKLARAQGVRTLNVVRRESLIAPLKALGADVVLVDGPDLAGRAAAATSEGNIRLAIDAVGGTATNRLAQCLAESGVVVNYGLLSGEPCTMDAKETVFRDISLRGFWLRRWYMTTPPAKIRELYAELTKLVMSGELNVEVEATYPFAQIKDAVAHAAREGRSGKIILTFDQ